MKKANISQLIFDDKNFNKGSEYGNHLINKSFAEFGAGRSILIDKNNKIIAGNKSAENYGALGNEDVLIIESDGTKLIAVKRTDIDLDTPQGRKLALADNATAKANIVWDEEIIVEEIGVEVAEEWGVKVEDSVIDYSEKNKEFNIDDFEDQKYTIKLEFTEEDYNFVKDKLQVLCKSPEKILYDALVSL